MTVRQTQVDHSQQVFQMFCYNMSNIVLVINTEEKLINRKLKHLVHSRQSQKCTWQMVLKVRVLGHSTHPTHDSGGRVPLHLTRWPRSQAQKIRPRSRERRLCQMERNLFLPICPGTDTEDSLPTEYPLYKTRNVDQSKSWTDWSRFNGTQLNRNPTCSYP